MRKRAGRNQNGLGTVEYPTPQTCRFRIKVDGERKTGPTIQATGDKKLDRKQAKAAYEKPKRQAAPPSPLLSSFLRSQLDGLAPKTKDLYERFIKNHIEGNPVEKRDPDPIEKDYRTITTDDIDAWKIRLFTKLSKTSTQRYMQFVAARFRKVKDNPFDGYELPTRDKVDKTVLSKAELARFYKLPWNSRMKIAVRLMAHGLRKSEACGLKFEDFDGEGVLIQRQAIEIAGKLEITDLKTANSHRWVPVDAELKKMLKKGTGWVLEGAKGKPLRGRTLHQWWTDTIEGTEFEGMTPHDLRSTFSMLLLEAGADVRTSAEILGHDAAVLSKIYARSRKEVKVAALEKIAALPTQRSRKQKAG